MHELFAQAIDRTDQDLRRMLSPQIGPGRFDGVFAFAKCWFGTVELMEDVSCPGPESDQMSTASCNLLNLDMHGGCAPAPDMGSRADAHLPTATGGTLTSTAVASLAPQRR